MKPFYVWHDIFLDELFAMEKNILDNEYPQLKVTLENEKVTFIEIHAEGMKDACHKYREMQDKIRKSIQTSSHEIEEIDNEGEQDRNIYIGSLTKMRELENSDESDDIDNEAELDRNLYVRHTSKNTLH